MINSQPLKPAPVLQKLFGDPRIALPTCVIRRVRLTWSEGFRANRHKANWGHFLIDNKSPEAAADKVAVMYSDKRDAERIRADLFAYFQVLKLETN